MSAIPSRQVIATSLQGEKRARAIRVLYAERCSVSEICAALGVDTAEVTRTLQRPVRGRRSQLIRHDYRINGRLAKRA